MKLVIFDLDGTLFRTETVDVFAINRALVANGYESRNDSEIKNLIGLTLEDVCISLTNTTDQLKVNKLKNDIIKFEKEEVQNHGQLYNGVLEGLNDLKKSGYTLCICSNGNKVYINEITEKFDFKAIFDVISFSDSRQTKSQRVGVIKKQYDASKFIMVGDRTSDLEAAQNNNGISIGVTYGFGKGEVKQADYIAEDFKEVVTIIEDLYK